MSQLTGGDAAPVRDVTETMVGFVRTLRAAGIDASPDRVQSMLTALDTLDVLRRADVYWSGRLTLCANHEDLERYDRAFDAYFSGEEPELVRRAATVEVLRQLAVPPRAGQDDEQSTDDRHTTAASSEVEVLRYRDYVRLSGPEREQVRQWLAALAAPGPMRRSRRYRPARRGPVDAHRTVRAILRHGGETARLHRHAHTDRPRRLVLIVDVSGSMTGYADMLLRFAHAVARRRSGAEVFTIGTRLTRVSTQMRERDADTALGAVSAAVPDWSGGTRLGDLLKAWLDRWGQRGMARGAVVVLASDGWERGEADLLGEQMARLHRLAHRVIWVNPHKAQPGYAPLAAGMAAALPHVDAFVEGDSLAAMERLAELLTSSEGPVGRPAADRRHSSAPEGAGDA